MSEVIIGGTSGLGLELAKLSSAEGKQVIVSGRHNPEVEGIDFRELNLAGDDLPERIGSFVMNLPETERLVYAAGYYQEGRISDLNQQEIEEMLDVGGRSLIYFMYNILRKQGQLKELVTITSTSQWTPRKFEPVYNFVKAGAGMFSKSMAEDGRVKKVVVAAPSGMRTAFWEGIKRNDFDEMLDPARVAEIINDVRKKPFEKYLEVRILRQPLRIEEVERR